MTDLKTTCCDLIETAMDMVRGFSVKDMSILKCALVSFGMLLAVYHHKACRKLAPLIWIVFIVAYAYLIGNLFFYYKAKKGLL